MRHGRSYTTTSFVGRAPVPATGNIVLGFAEETDSAFPMAFTASGFDKARPHIIENLLAINRAKRLLGKPVESFLMSPGANLGGAYLGIAVETDTGLAMVPAANIIPLGIATDTETGLPMGTTTKSVSLGLATETEIGLPLASTTGTVLLFATETDTGFPLAVVKAVALGLALETDSALNLQRNEVFFGLATETDTAFPLEIRFPTYFFTPPAVSVVPPILAKGDPAQTVTAYRLFRHFRSRPEGRNVYLLSNGVLTEDDPDGTDVLWARDDRTSENWDAPYVVRAYYGGHDNYELTKQEADALTAEGYTVEVLV